MADTVSVAEAARRLGVSGQTVRRKLLAGELLGEQTPNTRGSGWRWRVILPDEAPASGAPYSAPTGDPGARLTEQLMARIASLEGHLAEAERAASETRRLLAGTMARIEALTAPQSGDISGATNATLGQHGTQQSGNTPPRPWWRFRGR